jgi:shikimate kinase / 3-dehydroquinate synthase
VARPAIVFIGFMGAGKSTALAAARGAGLETTEIDELMEAELGKPIPRAFEEDGEEAFRAREAEVVASLLENADGGAIALGGGSVLSERVRKALDRHTVVLLEIDAAEAWRRIEGTERPLATSEADVERLLAGRLPLYEELADAVVPMVDAEEVSEAINFARHLGWMPAGTKMLWATSVSGAYPVYVGAGMLGATSDDAHWPLARGRFCITDEAVAPLYVPSLPSLVATVEIPPGEEAKTMAQAESVLRQLAKAGMTREDHVVALGGGVVGDLAGLCAHLYQRGVRVVQVPTTLVAQTDSAYGGKTGVDLPEGKNYAGAYHMPSAVIADTETLTSLPRQDISAGFVEALKTGLLEGGQLWDRVRQIEYLDPAELYDVVFACARYKCGVVAADEQDAGLRHVLNLGHTVGHGIETASNYSRYRHGEAIGLGLLAALWLSDAIDLRGEVEEILRRHDLPVRVDPGVPVDDVLSALERDKKRTRHGVGFVLLPSLGEPRIRQFVDPAKVREAVEELY